MTYKRYSFTKKKKAKPTPHSKTLYSENRITEFNNYMESLEEYFSFYNKNENVEDAFESVGYINDRNRDE